MARTRFVSAVRKSQIWMVRSRRWSLPSITELSGYRGGSCLQNLSAPKGAESRKQRQTTAAASWWQVAQDYEPTGSPFDLRNSAGNAVCGRLDGIVGEVGVAGGGLDLRMAQELADHGQALADEQFATGKACGDRGPARRRARRAPGCAARGAASRSDGSPAC